MFKKIGMFSFLVLFLLVSAPNVEVKALDIQPFGVVSVTGGLKHSSGNTYVLWGEARGAYEFKQITATLYCKEGTSWIFQDSSYSSDTDTIVETYKTVILASGYEYKVEVSGSTSTHTTTKNYFYDFR